MKKQIGLLIGYYLLLGSSFGQDLLDNQAVFKPEELLLNPINTSIGVAAKKGGHHAKALGDTLYYEDFDSTGTGGLPVGWSAYTNDGSSNNWIWSSSAPGGQYSATTAAINSSTAFNGFLSLPSDLYNTPFPGGQPVPMDAIISSSAIAIAPRRSVFIQWQQSQRYCCSTSNDLVLEISADSINWTSYDAAFGRNFNTAIPTPTSSPAERAILDVSAVLANEDTAYIRFRSTGNSHYYWMIDDLALVEGISNSISLESWKMNFSDTTYNPVYSMVPILALNPLSFEAQIRNLGSDPQTNVRLEVEVVHDSNLNGQVVSGSRFIQSSNNTPSLASQQLDTHKVPSYTITYGTGYYRTIFRALSDSINQFPDTAIKEQEFILTDSVFAKDRGQFVGLVRIGGFSTPSNDGDRIGTLFNVGGPYIGGCFISNSISVFIANSVFNNGVVIQPRIWEWNDTASSLNNAIVNPPIGYNAISTTITPAMLGTWIDLPLNPRVTIIPNKSYVVGVEQISGAVNNLEISLGRDRNVEDIQPPVTTYVYVNDISPSWGWTRSIPAIRWNLQLCTSVEEHKSNQTLEIFPNPSKGTINIALNELAGVQFEVRIRDIHGKLILQSSITRNSDNAYRLSLPASAHGLFTVEVIDGNRRWVDKVLVY